MGNKELVNCTDMIVKYLEENGYDGLCEPDNECGCLLNDLMPCDSEFAMWCEAGHRVECTCGEGCDFHVVAGKRESE